MHDHLPGPDAGIPGDEAHRRRHEDRLPRIERRRGQLATDALHADHRSFGERVLEQHAELSAAGAGEAVVGAEAGLDDCRDFPDELVTYVVAVHLRDAGELVYLEQDDGERVVTLRGAVAAACDHLHELPAVEGSGQLVTLLLLAHLGVQTVEFGLVGDDELLELHETFEQQVVLDAVAHQRGGGRTGFEGMEQQGTGGNDHGGDCRHVDAVADEREPHNQGGHNRRRKRRERRAQQQCAEADAAEHADEHEREEQLPGCILGEHDQRRTSPRHTDQTGHGHDLVAPVLDGRGRIECDVKAGYEDEDRRRAEHESYPQHEHRHRDMAVEPTGQGERSRHGHEAAAAQLATDQPEAFRQHPLLRS